jgi:hypothetical protein
VLAVLVTADVLGWRLGDGGDGARDIGARLDLVDDGPFALRLGGALWNSRTLSLLLAGHASVGTVKRALRRLGLTRRDNLVDLGYCVRSQGPRFDGDRGLKTPCDSAGTDVHVRLYAPSATDGFTDPQ